MPDVCATPCQLPQEEASERRSNQGMTGLGFHGVADPQPGLGAVHPANSMTIPTGRGQRGVCVLGHSLSSPSSGGQVGCPLSAQSACSREF